MKGLALRQLPGLLISSLLYAGGLIIGAQLETAPVIGGPDPSAAIRPDGFWFFLSHNAPLLVLSGAGALTGGVVTMILMLFNGLLLGNLLAVAHEEGILREGLIAVLPHAPFEVPAVLLAGAVGFMPVSVVARLAVGSTVRLKTELRDALSLLVAALFLVTLAAMVEAWITPSVIEWMNGGS